MGSCCGTERDDRFQDNSPFDLEGFPHPSLVLYFRCLNKVTRFQRDSNALVRVSRLLMRCPGGKLNVPLTSKTSINVPLVPDYRTLIRTRAFGFGFCLSRLIINFKFLVYCLSEEIPPPPLFVFSSMTTPSRHASLVLPKRHAGV